MEAFYKMLKNPTYSVAKNIMMSYIESARRSERRKYEQN